MEYGKQATELVEEIARGIEVGCAEQGLKITRFDNVFGGYDFRARTGREVRLTQEHCYTDVELYVFDHRLTLVTDAKFRGRLSAPSVVVPVAVAGFEI